MFWCFGKKKTPKKTQKKTQKKTLIAAWDMSHKVAQGFVLFGLSLPTIGLAWHGLAAAGAAAGAAGGQRVETFQKTQYILWDEMGWDGMGWRWRWSKAFYDY